MFRAYRALGQVSGARPLFAAGVVARLPRAMIGLGIVTMVARRTGDYALGGAVCAAYSLAVAALGPLVARAVDRHGQRRVARPALACAFGALSGLVACSAAGVPGWALFPCALAAGTMPNVGGLVRARWAHLCRDDRILHTAYSAESVADELAFVAGPILAVMLATVLFPEAGVLAAIAAGAMGLLALTAQRRTEPPTRPAPGRAPRHSVLRTPGMPVLVTVFVAFGTIFSSTEVITVAFATAQGHRGAAAFALAAFGVTSAVAGLVVGACKPRCSPPVRLAIALLALALSLLGMPFASGVGHLTLVLLLAGLFISPSLITTYGLVERLVAKERLNEGMTWLLSAITLGLSLGSVTGGYAADRLGAQHALWLPVCCAVASALLGALGTVRLRGTSGGSAALAPARSVGGARSAGTPGPVSVAPGPHRPRCSSHGRPPRRTSHEGDDRTAARRLIARIKQ
ncbi:MFS transporter [Streptomyces lunalinharesii]|uniref:MFS transporter n=1 Tax=Streptomyces lunalinharesii TaxID=333384 RepID=A0ABN3RQT9_9ACTN